MPALAVIKAIRGYSGGVEAVRGHCGGQRLLFFWIICSNNTAILHMLRVLVLTAVSSPSEEAKVPQNEAEDGEKNEAG